MSSSQYGTSVRCHRLITLTVVGGFLDGLHIDFAEGLNCLIGARGTGKTTVLEFVRYALDALPADAPSQKRIHSLVENNLSGGRIELAIENRDGLNYIISRSAGESPVVLDTSRMPTEIDLHTGGLFCIDIYSQNEVESIADQAGSQLNLIDNFQATRIASINHQITSCMADLDNNASQIIPLQQKISSVIDELRSLPDVNEQLKAYTQEGGSDAQSINQAHDRKSLRDREKRAIEAALHKLREAYCAVEAGVGKISQISSSVTDEMSQGPNGDLLAQLKDGLQTCSSEVDTLLKQAMNRIQKEGSALTTLATQLDLQHKRQDMGFHELIEKHKEAQGKATERARLERLRNDMMSKQQDKEKLSGQLQVLSDERIRLLQTLSELRDHRFELRKEIVSQINTTLSPAIRVSIVQYGDAAQYRTLLEDTLRGNRIKQGLVAPKIVNAFWPAELSEVIKQRDAQALVDKAELNPDQADKVIAVLSGSRALFDLETVELTDRPTIELNDNGVYKTTTELSTGQKCTTILPILLLDSENPLLIDQPEDNLDNRFVFENIVGTIGTMKKRRQLCFVTHNPNIPVLGEADRVFVMDSDGSTARRVNQGSVDDCKINIVTLLEGGEDAFRRRGLRYAS